jgi:methyl-accepting chemotaxis protein
VLFGFLLASKEYENKEKGILLLDRENTFALLSKLIHEQQIERGKSGLYIGSKITKEEFLTQQEKVNSLLSELNTQIVKIDSKELVIRKDKANQLRKLGRETAEQKDSKKIFPNYTASISELVILQRIIMEGVSFNGIEGRIKSLILFEDAKEGMGRLRGALNPTFSSGLKKDETDRENYIGYLKSITINLESQALQVNDETRLKANQILESEAWKKILEAFGIFSQKYMTGDYGVDAKSFSDTITSQINLVNELLANELSINIEYLKTEVETANRSFKLITIIVIALILFVSIISFFIIRELMKSISSISSQMNNSSDNLRLVVEEIVTASESLSSAANEQAAAIQETSSSLEEITSMINIGGEHIQNTTKLAEDNLSSVGNGKKIIDSMINSIESVANSNNIISKEVDATNLELGKIIQIINDLGTKIKVINDIVFQTKLLSFNASVEAARAGDQGKGFAVVAEEVGNLAQMSGQSAQEITGMLDHSMKTVDSIIENTKNKMSKIIGDSQVAIKDSVSIAGKCREVFDAIQGSSQGISDKASEVSLASKEQSSGVSEVNKAVAQLDQATQTIAKDAQGVVAISSNVNVQSIEIKTLSQNLKEIIDGKN